MVYVMWKYALYINRKSMHEKHIHQDRQSNSSIRILMPTVYKVQSIKTKL